MDLPTRRNDPNMVRTLGAGITMEVVCLVCELTNNWSDWIIILGLDSLIFIMLGGMAFHSFWRFSKWSSEQKLKSDEELQLGADNYFASMSDDEE